MDTKEASNAPKDTPLNTSLLLAEYTALRDEILKRMDIEHQLATFTLLMFGTILGIGVQYRIAPLILLYPTLALFPSIGWSHTDYMTMLIGTYIKEQIEAKRTDNTGWEQFWPIHGHSRYYWAMKGIFISTQVLAIVIGVVIGGLNPTLVPLSAPLMIVLQCVAIASLLFTSFFIFHPAPIKLRKLRIDRGKNWE
jgi:hypothetical protein